MVDLESNQHAVVVRVNEYRGLGSGYSPPHLYSTPSLIVMGSFFALARASELVTSRVIFLPGGSDGETNSSERNVSYVDDMHQKYSTCSERSRTLGPVAGTLEAAPRPRLAFQRFKLSSFASICAYSSGLFTSPVILYP